MVRPKLISRVKCALLLGFAGLFLSNASAWLTTPSLAQTQTVTTAAQAEKTAEQQFKNIKVLNGMPASQVTTAMNFMSASLGVNCAFCHAQTDGNWEFDKDEKREKGTARKMIQMVIDLNKNSFDGQPRVSCFTCHQGHEHTNGMVPLPQTLAADTPAGPEGPRGPAGPRARPADPAEGYFEKFIQAVGGKAALEQAKSRSFKGTQTERDGKAVNLEITQAPPNKAVETVALPQGSLTRGFDGTMGWAKGPRGQGEMLGEPLRWYKRLNEFNWPLTLRARFSAVRAVGKDTINGRAVLVVAGTVSEDRRVRLFFDAETGLLVREITLDRSLIGWIPNQIDYEDYREVSGVKMPFSIRLSLVDPRNSWTRKFTEIKTNVPVDDKIFSMPVAMAKP
ncbi:MAG: c-type cytochrome [Pyrinomonadaceae bacterium]